MIEAQAEVRSEYRLSAGSNSQTDQVIQLLRYNSRLDLGDQSGPVPDIIEKPGLTQTGPTALKIDAFLNHGIEGICASGTTRRAYTYTEALASAK